MNWNFVSKIKQKAKYSPENNQDFLIFMNQSINQIFFNQLDGLGGCPSMDQWVGDGICDDITNNIECNYDGGDCCLSDIILEVNTNYCTECLCHSSTIIPLLCNSTLAWIGDGFCDDATNNEGKKRLAQKTFNHLF